MSLAVTERGDSALAVARATLAAAEDRTSPLRADAERFLPVPADFSGLFPHGLRRGAIVSVRGSRTILGALAAEASTHGSWAVAVGFSDLGVLAIQETGVDLGRMALVPDPGHQAAAILAAIVDGVDLLLISARVVTLLGDVDRRRLQARIRERGPVVLVEGHWPGGQDELAVTEARWHGLHSGYGHLTGYTLRMRAQGRGAASRVRTARVTLPPGAAPTPLRLVGSDSS